MDEARFVSALMTPARPAPIVGGVLRAAAGANAAEASVPEVIRCRGLGKRYLDKLGLRDRVHAVVYRYEHGLITPGGAG